MFKELKTVTCGASLTLTITTDANGQMAVMALLRKNDDNEEYLHRDGSAVLNKPLVVRGDAEELDVHFVEQLLKVEEVKAGLVSSLGEIKREAEALIKEKKSAKEKQGAKPAPKPVAKPSAASAPEVKEAATSTLKKDDVPELALGDGIPEAPTAPVASTSEPTDGQANS